MSESPRVRITGSEGVELYDPIDTIHVTEAAFDRMMARYFQVIVEGVTSHDRPEAHEAWWGRWVEAADTLKNRVSG